MKRSYTADLVTAEYKVIINIDSIMAMNLLHLLINLMNVQQNAYQNSEIIFFKECVCTK